jgi:hemerythrin
MERILPWGEAFIVGHAGLDAEHRRIVEIINAIGADCETAGNPPDLLAGLRSAVATHFQHEDRILHAVDARAASARSGELFLGAMSQALIAEHVGQHARSLEILETIIHKTEGAMPVREVSQKLIHWFVVHAVKHDSHLKTLFQTMEKDCPKFLRELS